MYHKTNTKIMKRPRKGNEKPPIQQDPAIERILKIRLANALEMHSLFLKYKKMGLPVPEDAIPHYEQLIIELGGTIPAPPVARVNGKKMHSEKCAFCAHLTNCPFQKMEDCGILQLIQTAGKQIVIPNKKGFVPKDLIEFGETICDGSRPQMRN